MIGKQNLSGTVEGGADFGAFFCPFPAHIEIKIVGNCGTRNGPFLPFGRFVLKGVRIAAYFLKVICPDVIDQVHIFSVAQLDSVSSPVPVHIQANQLRRLAHRQIHRPIVIDQVDAVAVGVQKVLRHTIQFHSGAVVKDCADGCRGAGGSGAHGQADNQGQQQHGGEDGFFDSHNTFFHFWLGQPAFFCFSVYHRDRQISSALLLLFGVSSKENFYLCFPQLKGRGTKNASPWTYCYF